MTQDLSNQTFLPKARVAEKSQTQSITRLGFVLLSMVTMAIIFMLSINLAFAKGTPDNFVDLAEKLAPSVVNISSTQAVPEEKEGRSSPELAPGSPFQEFFEQFGNPRRDQEQTRPRVSMGSGFFISEDGYIVTNNHVISESTEVSVTTSDGDEYDAEVIGRDTDLDIALLKVKSDVKFKPLKFANSDDIRVGEWVLTIGNPFGLGGSVTAGIVSARHRRIRAGPYDDFIQTDASINRGNSGGPLLDMVGEVIGVNTMIFTPNGGNIGIGFSIPSNDVARTVEHLKEFGRPVRGWIGVSFQPITEDIAEGLGFDGSEGAVVGEVVAGGPAEAAGVKPNDVITDFDGKPVTEDNDLPRMVANIGVKKTVDLKVWRMGKVLTLKLTTGEKGVDNAKDTETETQDAAPSVDNNDLLGMRIAPLSDALREQFSIPSDINGLLIANLSRSSDAAQRGIRPGDVIIQANQRNVLEIDEFEDAIKTAKAANRKAILLRIYRSGSYFLVPLKLVEEKK